MSATGEAFANPQPGQAFHEMYSFWVVVVHVDKAHVIVMEASPPCTLPDDGKLRGFETHDDFRRAYSYQGGKSGYWVRLSPKPVDVSGWSPVLR